MIYNISPPIQLNSPGEWLEGSAYLKKNIYQITPGKMPPVNYDEHTLKPHSLTHIETPKHTQQNAPGIDFYIEKRPYHFYGECLVLKFSNDNWKKVNNDIYHKEIQLKELKEKLSSYDNIEKVLITVDSVQENAFGYHDPNFVLTLSLEAAEYLCSLKNFNLFGTSWKSSDFQPGSMDRPIHNELFKKALILEYINLNNVPEGEYFINCFPINLVGASESPVNAVLFSKE